MGAKNKGGRESRKPKSDHNKKTKGQTPAPGSVAGSVSARPSTPPKQA